MAATIRVDGVFVIVSNGQPAQMPSARAVSRVNTHAGRSLDHTHAGMVALVGIPLFKSLALLLCNNLVENGRAAVPIDE